MHFDFGLKSRPKFSKGWHPLWFGKAARLEVATCNLHLQELKKREACEVVIWGRSLPATLEEINFFEQEKQREINAGL